MIVSHHGQRPEVHESASVAPNAVLSGNVTIGPECRVLFGAVITAEGGPVTLGHHCIVMENAVIRGSKRHPAVLGDHVLVGPRAYLSGCTVGDSAFLAAGSTVFNGARIGARAEVRINGVVHIKTALPAGSTVPIGWVAVGDPAAILAPDRHDEIWARQEPLDFPGEVFGLARPASGDTIMPELTRRYSAFLAAHDADEILKDPPNSV
jgi:carbonic anhydrase/acetyltransferase-like protein (isoleucine patch superfamily)